jgi:transcriptional regulator with XRE-family HTH domain
MELPGNYNISRWEQDERTPNLNMLIVYYLIFEIPFETLFQLKVQELTIRITNRIELLIKTLKILPPDPKVQRRIAFLTQTLARLIM